MFRGCTEHPGATLAALPPDVRLCRRMCGGGSAPPLDEFEGWGVAPWSGLCPRNGPKAERRAQPNDKRNATARHSRRRTSGGEAVANDFIRAVANDFIRVVANDFIRVVANDFIRVVANDLMQAANLVGARRGV